jgi:hypothetical protein
MKTGGHVASRPRSPVVPVFLVASLPLASVPLGKEGVFA